MYIAFAATMVLLTGIFLFYWTLKHYNLEFHQKKDYIKDSTPSFEQIVILEIINRILRALPYTVMKGILIITSIVIMVFSLFWFSLLF